MAENYTIFDIAKWFLEKEDMQHKKLQKLCYYAQAWHYTLNDSPLFDGEFEAWAHGPVNRELWKYFRDVGFEMIKADSITGTKKIDKKSVDFLEILWNTYGEFDGWQLESLTHSESPWINARGGIPSSHRCTNLISTYDMKKCYLDKLEGDGIGE